MIPKDKIEEVKDRTNIVQVISEYLPLKKRGANHLGLCPFHSEKTPSFTVNEQKGIYYCFGCNSTGNAISFIMKKEGVEFIDAVRTLAQRAGISIEEKRTGPPDEREVMYGALKTAAEYFTSQLAGPSGAEAREYLKKRGFDGEILSRFGLGWAPNGWDGLVNWLRGKKIPLDAAEKAGLVGRKEERFYDRFRARVMFPITDVRGRVTGFGGRCLDDSVPKYLNSPETPVFKKGETLYGLFQAKPELIKGASAIVVEGYFDLMAMHKNGFTSAVATMGTALTPAHLRTLKGYTGLVYALFDSDAAGRNAAIRSLDMFLAEDLSCRAVVLSGVKDPDEFLGRNGPDALREAIAKAESLMEFYLKDLASSEDIKGPEGKKRYFDSAKKHLSMVKNEAEKGHYAKVVSGILGIGEAYVAQGLKGGGDLRFEVKPEAPVKATSKRPAPIHETVVLKVIISHPELLSERAATAVGEFTDPDLREAGMLAIQLIKAAGAVDSQALIEGITDERARARIAGLLLRSDEGFIEDPARMLEDCLKRVLKKGRLKECTMDFIESFEDADVAIEIRKRFEASSRGAKR